jgi:hypothetical protein
MAQQGYSQQVIANLVNQDIMMGYVPANGVPGMLVQMMPDPRHDAPILPLSVHRLSDGMN